MMKKTLLFLFFLAPIVTFCQNQPDVTAAMGSAYAGGTFTATQINPNGQSQNVSAFFDGSGNLSIFLAPGSVQQVRFCTSSGLTCGETSFTVLGSTQAPMNITTILQSGGTGSLVTGITELPQTGLMADYQFLASESPCLTPDHSSNGRNVTGCVGVSPTIQTTTGGLSLVGTGGLSVPSSLNSALSALAYVCFQPGSLTQASEPIIEGNSGASTSITWELYQNTASDAWGNAISGNYRFRTASVGNTFKSSSTDAFAGCGVIAVSFDSTDRFWINNQEVLYNQTFTSAGLQSAGNYQIGGVTGAYSTMTIYELAFYSSVLTTQSESQASQFMNSFAATRTAFNSNQNAPTQFLSTTYPTDSNNQLVCLGDSLTAAGVTYCNALTGVGQPGSAVQSYGSTFLFNISDQGLSGAGTKVLNVSANHVAGTLYRPQALANVYPLWAGTNDNNASVSLPNLRGECGQIRSWGGKCLLLTMISRTNEDVVKNQLNNSLRTQWNQFADALVDVAANPNLGADGASANATYFSDGVHLTNTGNGLVAAMVRRAVNRMVGNTPQTPITVPPQFQLLNSVTATCGAGASCAAPSITVTAGDLLFVTCVGNSGGTTFNLPTDTKTQTFVSAAANVFIGGAVKAFQAYYFPNAASGADVVTCNNSSSVSGSTIQVSDYSGVATTTPLDAAATASGGTGGPTITSGSATSTGSGDLAIAYSADDPTGTTVQWVPAPGTLLRSSTAGSVVIAQSDYITGTAGSYNSGTWTVPNVINYAVGFALFKPVSTPLLTYTLSDFDLYSQCNPTAGSTTITLPEAIGLTGQSYTISNTQTTGANTCTIGTTNSENIASSAGSATTFTLGNGLTATFTAILTSPTAGGASWRKSP